MRVEKFAPDVNDMPLFLWRLMTEVNWREEKECFWGICTELARFYAEAVKNGDIKDRDEVSSTTATHACAILNHGQVEMKSCND